MRAHHNKKFRPFLLCLIACVLLSACEASVPPETKPLTTEATLIDTEPLPIDTEGTLIDTEPLPIDAEVQILRVQDISQLTLEALMAAYKDDPNVADDIPSLIFETFEQWQAFLVRMNSGVLNEAAAGYAAQFFQSYNLVVIPSVTTSGSVRHSVNKEKTDSGITINLEKEMPEIGTTDMANWLILVPVEKMDNAKIIVRSDGGWKPNPGNNLVTE